MKKCKWLKDSSGRNGGHIETNDDDLVLAWEKAGLVEVLHEEVQEEDKSVDAPPVDKALKSPQVKKK
jgi:hypothetical protein